MALGLTSVLDVFDIRISLLFLLVFILGVWWMQTPRNLPPGPWRFPILGFLPQLMWYMYKGEEIHLIVTRLGEKYGKIYSFDLFGLVFVVMNDFAIAREGNNDPALQNKGYNNALAQKMLGSHIHSYKHNAEYRRFATASLRGLGIGKRSYEAEIAEESENLLDQLKTTEGKPCNPHTFLETTSANVIFKTLLGKRHEYENVKFSKLLELNHRLMELMGAGAWSLLLPRYFPNKESREMLKYLDEIAIFLDKIIAEHRENYDDENPSDFIDLYLQEIEKNPAPDDPWSYLQDENMKRALFLLFAAGGDTASTTLEWCCLYMMAYPDIQEKIHQEIDSVVGRNRLPQMSDGKSLPYTKAALLEIQRHVTLTPLSDFKAAGSETSLCGYRIPKGATIITNIYSVMRDPIAFPEPDKFKPERHIDENGEYFENDQVVPFGIGRRRCPGEHVAKMELFIMFTHLLHRFSIVKPDDTSCVSFEGVFGALVAPKPFTAKFVPRI